MRFEEEEIVRLRKQISELQNKISDYQILEYKHNKLLSLTGLRDKECQYRGAYEVLLRTMNNPALKAKTPLGKIVELESICQKVHSYKSREDLYGTIPENLKPSNFGRNLANRREACERWKGVEKEANNLMEEGLLGGDEWQEVSGPDGLCSLDKLEKFLINVRETNLFQEELTEQLAVVLEGVAVPEDFLSIAAEEVSQQADKFRYSQEDIPQDWSNCLTSVIHKGFQPQLKPWEVKGMTKEEWEDAGDLALVCKNSGYEKDFWYSLYSSLSKEILKGNVQGYKAVIRDYLPMWSLDIREAIVISRLPDGTLTAAPVELELYAAVESPSEEPPKAPLALGLERVSRVPVGACRRL